MLILGVASQSLAQEESPTPSRAIRALLRHSTQKPKQSIAGPRIDPSPGYADFFFRTTQPTVPIIEVSKQPPRANMKFDQTVSSAFPFLGGKLTDHQVRVANLKSKTTYYYIITAADEEGALITKTGTFKTPVGID